MKDIKDLLLGVIEMRATRNLGKLASELVRAQSEDKEPILAEIEWQRWLANSCQECRNPG